MKLLEAFNEIADWMFTHPLVAAFEAAMVLLCLLTLWACGVPMLYGGPPVVACWLLGVHVALQVMK